MSKLFSGPESGAHIVATIVTVGFVAVAVFLTLHPAVEPTSLLKSIYDTLSTCFVMVVAYYVGSSASSARKSAQIDHLIGRPTDTSALPSPQA